MKPRFEPDVPADEDENASANLIDPEAYDASEQQFPASLEQTGLSGQSRSVVRRFVVEEEAHESTHGIEQETPSGTSEMQAETSDIAVPIPAEPEPHAPVDPAPAL